MKRMIQCLALMAALAWWGSAIAAPPGPASVRDRLEASMVVTGTVDVDATGSTRGFTLDRADEIPGVVRDVVAASVPHWRFAPDGGDVGQRDVQALRMSLRVVADRIDDEQYRVMLRSAWFGETGEDRLVRSKKMSPPPYPADVMRAHGSGIVYLMLRIDRDGQVADAAVERTDITRVANDRTMERWRTSLARSALGAARKWQFAPPVEGPGVDAGGWVVRVPVTFALTPSAGYGTWTTYVPGERQQVPWARPEAGDPLDSLSASGVFQVGSERTLLTPLQQG
ncbi:protein tonB [Luteimonas sp. MJ174]|uniref:protein tonB n=1 Tax=Luteimonas sp. MJ174 TaxID=3129237 RepID=UPI0031BB6345